MNKYLILLCLLAILSGPATGQSFLLIKDPGIREIINEETEIEKIAGDFQFTEGPVWHPDGKLFFSDIPANKVMVWEENKGVSTYLEPSGRSNGLAIAEEGLILCQHEDRQLALSEDGDSWKVLTDQYQGKKFNSPNDLVVRSDGSIYFTDPAWGLPKQEEDPAKEIPYQGLYRYHEGEVILLDNSLSSPNGLAFSPDEKWLYVANLDKMTGERFWVRYRVKKDGSIKGKKLFADASDSLEKGSPDGMAVDIEGNVYCTGPGGVLIYDKKGTWLGLIRFPELPANVCFGGPDGKTLYATARTSVYRINLNIKGFTPIYPIR